MVTLSIRPSQSLTKSLFWDRKYFSGVNLQPPPRPLPSLPSIACFVQLWPASQACQTGWFISCPGPGLKGAVKDLSVYIWGSPLIELLTLYVRKNSKISPDRCMFVLLQYLVIVVIVVIVVILLFLVCNIIFGHCYQRDREDRVI